MRSAVILGGTGAIGTATAMRLTDAGWRVTVTGRDPTHLPAMLAATGVRFASVDGHDLAELRAAGVEDVDLLVDCVCYSAVDAHALASLAAGAGSTVMISSKAVYADSSGRHTNSVQPPCFDGPITESQPTVPPGDGDFNNPEGYPRNKVAAEQVLLDSDQRVSVLRASKVHGAWARNPREWIFVKRVLDRRAVVLLAAHGGGVDHTSAAANVAALIETVAAEPGTRILNAADPDAPSALDIARTVTAHLGHDWREVLLGDGAPPDLGRTPWDAPHPIVLDTSAASSLGYRPVGDYAETVVAELDWLVRAAQGGEGADLVPAADDRFFAPLLDYSAEDAYLSALDLGSDPSRGK